MHDWVRYVGVFGLVKLLSARSLVKRLWRHMISYMCKKRCEFLCKIQITFCIRAWVRVSTRWVSPWLPAAKKGSQQKKIILSTYQHTPNNQHFAPLPGCASQECVWVYSKHIRRLRSLGRADSAIGTRNAPSASAASRCAKSSRTSERARVDVQMMMMMLSPSIVRALVRAPLCRGLSAPRVGHV